MWRTRSASRSSSGCIAVHFVDNRLSAAYLAMPKPLLAAPSIDWTYFVYRIAGVGPGSANSSTVTRVGGKQTTGVVAADGFRPNGGGWGVQTAGAGRPRGPPPPGPPPAGGRARAP